MTSPKRAPSRFLRRSAFDIAALGLLTLIAFMPVPNAIFLSGFVFAIAVIDRLMMLWRKRCADDDTLDSVRQDAAATREDVAGIRETMRATVQAMTADDEPQRPDLRIVPPSGA